MTHHFALNGFQKMEWTKKKKETKIASKITTASIFTGQVASYSEICLVSTPSWDLLLLHGICLYSFMGFVKYKKWLSDLPYQHHGGSHG